MDYSTTQEESPADASPWANSPQQTQRPAFTSSMASPPSPQAAQQQQQYSYQNAPQNSGPRPDSEAHSSQDTTVRNGHSDQPYGSSEQAPGGVSRQQQQQPPQRAPMVARTPSQRQQASTPNERPQPQYKLQAKVNGFERTGRKDPILRFDIHVCTYKHLPYFAELIRSRRTCQGFGPHNFATFEEHMENFRSSPTTLSLPMLKPSCPRSLQPRRQLVLVLTRMKQE